GRPAGRLGNLGDQREPHHRGDGERCHAEHLHEYWGHRASGTVKSGNGAPSWERRTTMVLPGADFPALRAQVPPTCPPDRPRARLPRIPAPHPPSKTAPRPRSGEDAGEPPATAHPRGLCGAEARRRRGGPRSSTWAL